MTRSTAPRLGLGTLLAIATETGALVVACLEEAQLVQPC